MEKLWMIIVPVFVAGISVFVGTRIFNKILCVILSLITAFSGVAGLFLFLNKEQKELPVVLYHRLTQDISETGDYCITVDELESDLKYLKENGYETINIAELLTHIKQGADLPEKPIILTFDDGDKSVYAYLLPLLEKYDMCAVLSIVGNWIGDDGFLNWDEVAELSASGRLEIQNHSYNMHIVATDGRQGLQVLENENFEEYSEVVNADVGKLQDLIEEKTGKTPTAFTYPWGINSDESKRVLKSMGFEAAITANGFMNEIDYTDMEWLYQLGRFNRPSGISTTRFFDEMK